jgi:hypothetical protein
MKIYTEVTKKKTKRKKNKNNPQTQTDTDNKRKKEKKKVWSRELKKERRTKTCFLRFIPDLNIAQNLNVDLSESQLQIAATSAIHRGTNDSC